MAANRLVSTLREHAERGRSGELVCVCAAGEVHVYLQKGRVAWATDSQHPFAFGAHLQEVAAIDLDTFRQVVEECRRDRLSLGETLVAWGLASWENVRSSLAHQIRLALGVLAAADDEAVQTLFLERVYRKYDEALTFDVADLLTAAPSPPPRAAASVAPLSTSISTRSDLAKQLRASIEGLSWVEVIHEDRIVDSDPISNGPRVSSNLVRTTLLDGADFAAVRVGRGAVVGLTTGPASSVWARLAPEATFGAVVASIASLVAAKARRPEPTAPRSSVSSWDIQGRDAATALAISSFLERAHDVLGVIVLAGDAQRTVTAGNGRSWLDSNECIGIARRRVRCFTEGTIGASDPKPLASMGFYLRTLVSGEEDLWCFGAELEADTGETAWMFLDRKSSQGLGWACLSALTRILVGRRTVSVAVA